MGEVRAIRGGHVKLGARALLAELLDRAEKEDVSAVMVAVLRDDGTVDPAWSYMEEAELTLCSATIQMFVLEEMRSHVFGVEGPENDE